MATKAKHITRKSDSFTQKLLKTMAKSRQGMTRPEIWKLMADLYGNDPEALSVYLCQLVRKGSLRTDGRRECPGCMREHIVYRITEKGRMRLWLNN